MQLNGYLNQVVRHCQPPPFLSLSAAAVPIVRRYHPHCSPPSLSAAAVCELSRKTAKKPHKNLREFSHKIDFMVCL